MSLLGLLGTVSIADVGPGLGLRNPGDSKSQGEEFVSKWEIYFGG